MKIAFCSDHRGFNLKKELIKKVINELNYEEVYEDIITYLHNNLA